MSERNPGATADVLFVGVTRPPMRWGVTYSALLFNMVFALEAFLLTRNLITLAVCLPIHGICMLLCARDARYFDLVVLWMRTQLPARLANWRVWKSSSYSALPVRVARRPVPEAMVTVVASSPRGCEPCTG